MSSLHLPGPVRSIFLAISALSIAVVHGSGSGSGYPTDKVQWKPCPSEINDLARLQVDCGTLTVPLDYTNLDGGETLELSLLRVPAVVKTPVKKKQHSILFNFGGPGLEARVTLAELADLLQVVTGGEHDLIAWDPRGTAQTLTFSCFADATSRAALGSQTPLGNASDVSRGLLWAGGKNTARACAEYPQSSERGPFIDSSFTARDAMKIVDAVEEDGLLRYWGLSYGTVLGAEIAALFPERVEKVLLDGVVNPTEYFHEMTLAESTASSDATFSEFFRQCVSTPKYCSLARNNPDKTAEDLESATWDLIEELKYRPFGYEGQVIGYTELKTAIRFTLYAPQSWVTLEGMLDAFLTHPEQQQQQQQQPRNLTRAGEAITRYLYGNSVAALTPPDDAAVGIACVDKVPRTIEFDVLSQALDHAESVSRLLGDSVAALVSICAQWGIEPKDRYRGRFEDVRPRKPLLIAGNTYDPATSIVSARNLTETIKRSVLFEHGGVGHATIQHPSLCTARTIQAFFRNGTLPRPDTYCPPVAPPFLFAYTGPTWQDLFPQLGVKLPNQNGSSIATRQQQQQQQQQQQTRGSIEDSLLRIGRRQRYVP
ncbi:TAP-like protein-domain-containing protein [Poronia punctata]|nr:TAP-like protein-domain-containing protein [Poronia punctata]